MPLPSNPTVGQIETYNGRRWIADAQGGWALLTNQLAPDFSLIQGSPMDNAAIAALLGSDVLGGAVNLQTRLNVSAAASSGLFGGRVAGGYADIAAGSTASATSSMAANRIDLVPWVSPANMRIDQLGVAVSTAAATGGLARMVIYNSDVDRWPGDKLLQTVDFLVDTTGFRYADVDFTFAAGTKYWLGVHAQLATTVRSVPVAGSRQLGFVNPDASSYVTLLRRGITFANGLPNSWGFITSDAVGNQGTPSIRFRYA
jgi:hypothetical protein